MKKNTMGSVCDEQQHHKFRLSQRLHHLTENPSPHREVDIPPRNLLARRNSMESPNAQSSAVFSTIPPSNNPLSSDSDSDDPYSSDHFRMYEFKIRKCGRIRIHDWIDCPFSHQGEKALRRDPRRFPYSSTVCPHFRKGGCRRGDGCEFSHGIFESWLHPSRYRTQACKDGNNCKRKICFFAHSASQLRILPETHPSPAANNNNDNNNELNSNCRCAVCRSITASPTSTLMTMSPISPPASPMFSQQMSPLSPYDRRRAILLEFMSASGMSHEEVMMELMASYEAMTVSEARPVPSTPVRVGPSELYGGGFSGGRNLMEDDRYNGGGSSSSNGANMEGPDLSWVNDLLS